MISNDIKVAEMPINTRNNEFFRELSDKLFVRGFNVFTEKINETEIFQKLNLLKYDSLTPNFVEIESLVISMVEIDQVLFYCKDNFVLDSPLNPSREQCFINGVGLLQTLFYQQNCIMRLYKCFTGKKLELPHNMKRIRDNRHIVIGHPDERQFIPEFDECGCWSYSFDDEEKTELIFYSTTIKEQEEFVINILEKLIRISHGGETN